MLRRALSGLVFYLLAGSLTAYADNSWRRRKYPTGSNPQAAAVGDFNGDGNQDLAIANSTSNTISVLLGKGDAHSPPRWITQLVLHLRVSPSETSTGTDT